MTHYYNEIEPYPAQWLRNLMPRHIPGGYVDERDIRDIKPYELAPYKQCHFFAGIAGWAYALTLAGFPLDREVWTGSCPCQPFSQAGRQLGNSDPRHLWPAWFWLIRQCRPATIFGEQVASAIGHGWLDLVFSDLESEGYACGASILPACGVGAPHIRQRLWFVGDSNGERSQGRIVDRECPSQRTFGVSSMGGGVANSHGRDASAEGLQRGGQHGQRAQDGGAGELAHGDRSRRGQGRPSEAGDWRDAPWFEPAGLRTAGDMADTSRGGFGEQRDAPFQESGGYAHSGFFAGELGIADGNGREPGSQAATTDGYRNPAFAAGWDDLEWLPCSDGKSRPTQPGLFPLAHGVSRRTFKLRAYGNAIVPQIAAEFIKAFLATEKK